MMRFPSYLTAPALCALVSLAACSQLSVILSKPQEIVTLFRQKDSKPSVDGHREFVKFLLSGYSSKSNKVTLQPERWKRSVDTGPHPLLPRHLEIGAVSETSELPQDGGTQLYVPTDITPLLGESAAGVNHQTESSHIEPQDRAGPVVHTHTVTHQSSRGTRTTVTHNSEIRHVSMNHPGLGKEFNEMLVRESSMNRTEELNNFLKKEQRKKTSHTIDDDIMSAYGGYSSYSKLKMPNNHGHSIASLDMCLTPEQSDLFDKKPRVKRKAIRPTKYLWTDAVIPYTIEPSFDLKDVMLIRESMSVWEQSTCVKFREATDRDENYVTIVNGAGCSSHVGMIGGPQELTLHKNCRKKPIIVHELGHAIGMIHEHQRPDRGEYVNINTNNAMANTESDFKMYSWNVINDYGVGYDYKSIMHYGPTAFSSGSGVTIQTRDPAYQNVIGKATTISKADIDTVAGMYKCPPKVGPSQINDLMWLSSLFPTSAFADRDSLRSSTNRRQFDRWPHLRQPTHRSGMLRQRPNIHGSFNRNLRPTSRRFNSFNPPWFNNNVLTRNTGFNSRFNNNQIGSGLGTSWPF